MPIPPILCVAGDADSGAAPLLERLIPALRAGGMKVGLVRRRSGEGLSGPAVAPAGACPSVTATSGELIVQFAAGCPVLLDLAAELGGGCDLLLAEGFGQSSFDTIPPLPPEAVAVWVRQWLDRRIRLGRGVMGAVLIGGRGRRMGSDKAAMRVGGQAVLPRLVELLAGRTGEVWTIGRAPPEVGLPRCVRWHLDLRPGCGPLGGIATALRVAAAAGREAVLAVACDMPRLTGEVLDFLLASRRQDRPATAIRNPSTGFVEPLAAIYETASLAQVERALDAGELSPARLLERLAAHIVDAPPAWADCLVNVNTPEQRDRIDGSTAP